MALTRTAELVEDARRAGCGVLAVNVLTLEHLEAVAAGAALAGRPAIVQVSQNAVRYHGGLEPLAAAAVAVAGVADADLALHLDHVEDERLLRRAADLGFGSVMVDASALPYRQNVAATAVATTWAHQHGLWVEAELGFIGGKPDSPADAHAAGTRTDPAEGAAFVDDTGVDALAVAVGSSHAMSEQTARIDAQLVAALRERIPVPLVLHGSSGVDDEQLRAAVTAGITKVNVGTALNVALTRAVRHQLAADDRAVDPRGYLGHGREAMTAVVAHLLAVVATPRSTITA